MIADAACEAVLDAFRQQVRWCERLGSPFTARVLRLLSENIGSGGIAADLVCAWPGEPVRDAVALRLAGALHALVLRQAAPRLASLYPPDGRVSEDLGPALIAALSEHRTFVERFLLSPPQTNEVGRSAVLLGGFLTVARDTGLPLRTLEIGASAGMNSLWDRFRYRLGGRDWGDLASPVTLAPDWNGPPPPLEVSVSVVGRRACDVAPVDLADATARMRLFAYVWPDQGERLARLAGAIGIARREGIQVEQADAADWVEARLGHAVAGSATVLFHSIMWHYMPEATRIRVRAALIERRRPPPPRRRWPGCASSLPNRRPGRSCD